MNEVFWLVDHVELANFDQQKIIAVSIKLYLFLVWY